MEKEQ
jgi:hypothetical protein